MKYKYQKGFSRKTVLFGPCKPRGIEARCLILCEGPLDAVIVQQAIDNAGLYREYQAAAILGDYISEEQSKLVAAQSDDVILFFDNDQGGETATRSAVGDNVTRGLLSNKGVFVSVVDYGKSRAKDPGELEDYEIMRMIRDAKPALSRKVEQIYGSQDKD